MSILSNYLAKYSFRDQQISAAPEKDLGLIVVIPAHDEIELITSVESLKNCQETRSSIEVIVVFNASENDSRDVLEQNEKAKKNLKNWFEKLDSPRFKLFCLEENSLPKKHAGVGLARKIGMDEAIRRFEVVGNIAGVVVCFDADSQCRSNYLQAIEKHFRKDPKVGACSIHFEHPIQGSEFTAEVYQGISYYELHLRYYKNALVYADLPFAFHTIGSSMAVRAQSYCEQGGMNRRKAGEDFYFLQKFIDVGTLNELKTTTVIPSPRFSHRVPFGTGRAIQEMLDDERQIEKSYAFECFEVLKKCFENIEVFYRTNEFPISHLIEFVGEENWKSKMAELKRQSTTKDRFRVRFFQWFNAFQTLKFIHFLRDNYFENELLNTEVPKLLKELKVEKSGETLLEQMRRVDLD